MQKNGIERLFDNDGCKDRTDTKEIERVTNSGTCIFDDCQGKATGWIYNIDCSVDVGATELLHACKKHVDLFQCHEDKKEVYVE